MTLKPHDFNSLQIFKYWMCNDLYTYQVGVLFLFSPSLLLLPLFLSCQSSQVQSVCSSILSEDTAGGRGGGAGKDEGSRGERVS